MFKKDAERSKARKGPFMDGQAWIENRGCAQRARDLQSSASFWNKGALTLICLAALAGAAAVFLATGNPCPAFSRSSPRSFSPSGRHEFGLVSFSICRDRKSQISNSSRFEKQFGMTFYSLRSI